MGSLLHSPFHDEKTIYGVEGCGRRSTNEIQKCTTGWEDDVQHFLGLARGYS